ncbi:DUF7573 domain-containing protein [Halovenus salina]|uniref:DUF7573 domain-containing protein n=1 Tax=Halovenus salina TaxID=1510225 RepID=A0ABD5VXF8_9EURY|nr:hypothetical protein [Halovenus salina]
MDDTSLDEFVDGYGEESAGGNDSEHSSEPTADESPSADDIEPAAPTSELTPSKTDCQQCGKPTERLWRDDGEFVCQDCKDW